MKVPRIDAYFASNKKFVSEVIARLVSIDGLTFHLIANSALIRRAFKADAYFLPTSPQTTHNHFMKEFVETIKIVSEKTDILKKNECHFSISFDQATSVRNRGYMNLNQHNEKTIYSLSMIRVKGSMETEKAIELVKQRLTKFNLSHDSDIVSTITDGASVMMKFGRLTKSLHISCLAHATRLCICDVLYKKNLTTPKKFLGKTRKIKMRAMKVNVKLLRKILILMKFQT